MKLIILSFLLIFVSQVCFAQGSTETANREALLAKAKKMQREKVLEQRIDRLEEKMNEVIRALNKLDAKISLGVIGEP